MGCWSIGGPPGFGPGAVKSMQVRALPPQLFVDALSSNGKTLLSGSSDPRSNRGRAISFDVPE